MRKPIKVEDVELAYVGKLRQQYACESSDCEDVKRAVAAINKNLDRVRVGHDPRHLSVSIDSTKRGYAVWLKNPGESGKLRRFKFTYEGAPNLTPEESIAVVQDFRYNPSMDEVVYSCYCEEWAESFLLFLSRGEYAFSDGEVTEVVPV